MAFTIHDGTTLHTFPAPDKNGIKVHPVIKASSDDVLSGKFRADVTSERVIVEVYWPYLWPAERTALRAIYAACRHKECVLTLHNGDVYTVFCGHLGFPEEWYFDVDSNLRYNVTLQFESVTEVWA